MSTSFLFIGEPRPLGTALKIGLPLSFLDPCLSKRGPWPSSISTSTTWELVRIAVQVEPQGLNFHFNKHSRWFVCKLKFEECCLDQSKRLRSLVRCIISVYFSFPQRACHGHCLPKYSRINIQQTNFKKPSVYFLNYFIEPYEMAAT